MKGLYVVRRDFKAGGQFFQAGTVLEDVTTVKLFKIRINEGLLMSIPEDKEQLDNLCNWFDVRLGVDLRKNIAEREIKGSDSAEIENTGAGDPNTTPGTSDEVTPGTSDPETTVESVGDPGLSPVSATPEVVKPVVAAPKTTVAPKPATVTKPAVGK